MFSCSMVKVHVSCSKCFCNPKLSMQELSPSSRMSRSSNLNIRRKVSQSLNFTPPCSTAVTMVNAAVRCAPACRQAIIVAWYGIASTAGAKDSCVSGATRMSKSTCSDRWFRSSRRCCSKSAVPASTSPTRPGSPGWSDIAAIMSSSCKLRREVSGVALLRGLPCNCCICVWKAENTSTSATMSVGKPLTCAVKRLNRCWRSGRRSTIQ
mmetsp:Transcript_136536/g.353960  ORF Transcript_136536/g.353960 Transcript_136536/m.353960 type:complete len:209 (+) Transcript_136536:2305-2931(+)